MSNLQMSCREIRKTYSQGTQKLEILKGINLEIREEEALCITGASGAGKSTLLHILGSLDRPSSGHLFFEGHDVFKKNDEALSQFRNQTMGFVFQFHHLLKEFSALENVMLPCRIRGMNEARAKKMSEEILEIVGLSSRLTHYPSELSGGEQQRVAVARALVLRPKLLLADEPTGNLDTTNGLKVQDLFFQLKKDHHLTLIVVSHDKNFAARFPRTIEIRDGKIMPTSETAHRRL